MTTGATPLRFGYPADRPWEPAADTLPLADRVASRILARQAAAAGGRRFVQFGDAMLTYAEADARANRTAHALASLGVGAGGRVAILLRNRLEYLDLWFGLTRLGAIQVPVNTEYRSPQILHVFRRAPIDLVMVEAALLPELLEALRGLTAPPPVVLVGDPPATVPGGFRPFAVLGERVAQAPAAALPGADRVSGADTGAVMNTSGTTGPSKGVCLTHAQQYILGRNIAADMALGPGDVYYNFFPLFHNTAQAMITLPVLLCGASMVLTERFSASRFWPEAISHGCTAFYYIGEVMRILLKSTSAQDARGSRLRVGWGIGGSPADMAEFASRFGVRVCTGYGSTEGNVPVYRVAGCDKPASVGRVVPGFDVRIADDQGVPLPPGRQGEILIRSDEPCAVMQGYDGDPAATVAAWRDLWFHSGDAGVMDADGDLFFMGRVKDVIRVRGENVSAFEIEEVLAAVDGVVEVAAIAVPSELGGDDVKAVVVARAGAAPTPQALVAAAQARLPRYAVPRYVEFVAALPKTPTNKVQKHLLREQPFTAATWDRAKLGSG